MASPSAHVIIGNLPEDLDQEGFKTNFEAYGTIKWCKLNGKGAGGTKSGMIEFDSVDEATWLVENLDGNVPLGLETEVTVKYKTAGAGAKAGGGGVAAAGGKGLPAGGKNRSEPYGGGGKGGGGGGGKGGGGGFGGGFGGGCGGGFAGGIVPNSKGGGKMGQMMSWMGGGKMGGQTTASMTDLWKGLMRHQVLPGGTWANDERTALISGLPSDTTEYDVLKIFSTFGAVLPGGVRVTLNDDGTAKGNAMINFREIESTQLAIETLNDCMLPDGAMLRVRQFSGDWAKNRKGKGGGKAGGKAGPKTKAEE